MIAQGLHVIFGAGPLGLAVAEHLVDVGGRVRLVSRSGRTTMPGTESVAADVMNPDAARVACDGATTVYQCAAPAYQNWPNEFPALQENILQGAARAGAVLVVAENLYGYGVAGVLHEGLPLSATTRKGRTRAALSQRLFDAHATGEVRAVAGRASDFFGPAVRQSALGERFWRVLLKGKSVDWFGNPDALHSFTYVPDFARALIRLGAVEKAWGRAWHVPSPAAQTPRQVIQQIAGLAGIAEPTIRQTPALMLRLVGLIVPAAGEVVEMGYSYGTPLVLDDQAYRDQIGGTSTDWGTALAETLKFWRTQ